MAHHARAAPGGSGEHDAMTVRGGHRHLAFSPWSVLRSMEDDSASRDKLRVQGIHIAYGDIGKIAVITNVARRGRIGTMAEHYPYLASRERLPAIAVAPLGPKTQDIDKISHIAVEIGD